MKTNEEEMTPTEAAGFIVGVGVGFVRRYYKIFSVLIALGGLGMMLTGFRLTIGPSRFEARFGEGALIGAAMIAISVVLWFTSRTPRKW